MRPSRRIRRTAASAVVLLAMLGLVVVSSPAAAHPGHTIVVTTIQAAVDAARSGDIVLVPPGTYRLERNQVLHNNLPNPVPADSGDEIGLAPTGAGIVNLGGDRVVIRDNQVLHNDSLGIAIVQNLLAPTDPRIEPNPDFNQVHGNVILHNGQDPDPVRAITPGADIVYDGTGTETCFADNVFVTEFPAGITALFPCAA